ncbi:MAG: AAA family ATPase [Clostridiales bacterium]
MKQQFKEVTIKVNIFKEIFRKDDFAIYIAGFGHEEISVKVNGFDLPHGPKTLVGYWGKEYNGQKTFNCSYEEFDNTSKEAQFNLLCSIDGIKERTAEKIMEQVEDINIFRTNDYPKIKDIGKARLILIREGLEKLDKMVLFKNLNLLLGGKCSKENISKINKVMEFKQSTIEDFKKNPYELLINYLEMSFKKADEIAIKMGISKDNYIRNKYLTEYIVYAECKSNCYIEYDILSNKLREYGLSSKFPLADLLDNNERLVVDGIKVYTEKIYTAETEVPKILNFLNEKGNQLRKEQIDNSEDIEKLIAKFETRNKIKFDKSQIEAITTSATAPISVITGGAGVGKTTILKCVLFILGLNHVNVLTAPTGKASRHMNQATGIEASTIHSYIYQEAKEDIDEVGFIMNESEKVNFQNNQYYTKSVMVIDEFSMVDIVLFYKLLSVMMDQGSFTKLIMVGDPGQLPSVQPGNVLHDLIEANVYPVIKLQKTFRQGKESNIIPIASSIRNNEMFDFIKKPDFFVRECIDGDEYQSQVYHMYKHLYNKYDNLDDFYNEVQFISPLKKGETGVNAVNELIKKQFNPKESGLNAGDIFISENDINIDFATKIKKGNKYKIVNFINDGLTIETDNNMKFTIPRSMFINNFKKVEFPFDINDKVMNIKNDKENDIYNGEFGRVIDISCNTFTVYFQDLHKEIKYIKTTENINKFMLSYCCTVHKLQGSEFKYICLVLSTDSPLCDSRLLYTGITRGKQTVILLTEKGITEKVVSRNNLHSRNTFLKERLIECKDKNKESEDNKKSVV